jgi:very-short-patch-repair endonuclease
MLSHRRLEMALDRSERLGLFDLSEIDRLLERAGHHPGVTRLRRALDLHREPAFTRSGLERRFLKLVREAGLPKPSTTVFVAGFELDIFWEAERFAVELDGYEFHRGRREFEADRVRQEELKLAGIEMVRLTARRVADEPKKVMERVAALLERRRREQSSLAGSAPAR